MKKRQAKRKSTTKPTQLILPTGVVITDLIVWCFSDSEEVIRHSADQISKAIQMSYSLMNFGPAVFNLSEEEME
jgi:hypothetical protein